MCGLITQGLMGTMGIVVVIFIVFIILYKANLEKERKKISFKESMDLTDLPVITLYQEDKKFNFLLDTGSNDSIISKPASKSIKGTYVKCKTTIDGLGRSEVTKACATTLTYKENSFDMECLVSEDITSTFNEIKKVSGVHIHGILGTKFLQKYKYILDFDELVAYKK